MLLGYLSLSILTVLISVFALSSLERINSINNSVIKTDVPLIEATDKMVDNLLAQELYGRRYVLLKSPDMLELFWRRSEEFNHQVEQVSSLKGIENVPVSLMVSLHKEYNSLFIKGVDYMGTPSSLSAKKYDAQIMKKQEELINLIKDVSARARSEQKKKTLMTAGIGTMAFRVSAVLSALGILIGLSAAILITKNISGSIRKLKYATKQISEGTFDYTPDIENQDELGELSDSFGLMAQRLKRLEEMNLDASPLTRLPGGVAIENVVKKRIESNALIAFCLVDLDNFKVFNDRYGYARGSEVIKATARIIENTVEEHGISDDFIGHIGGDDFIVVSSPDRYKKICNAIIDAFDKMIPDFYDPEDRKKGYIEGKTRQGQEMTFPIMTVSIGVVTNQNRKLINTIQVGELAAELKDYAKSIPGSLYVVDKRRKDSQQEISDENVIRFPKNQAGKRIKMFGTHSIARLVLLVFIVLLSQCTPAPLHKDAELKDMKFSAGLKPKDFPREIARLEKIAKTHPDVSVQARAHLQLALLHADHKNRSPII